MAQGTWRKIEFVVDDNFVLSFFGDLHFYFAQIATLSDKLLGRPRKITEKQIKKLEKALDQGAYAFGYAGDYWTLDRIAQIIWQLFKMRYHLSAV